MYNWVDYYLDMAQDAARSGNEEAFEIFTIMAIFAMKKVKKPKELQ